MSPEVAVMDGRLLAWVPGRLKNSLNRQRGHWSTMHKYQKEWRSRTLLCIKDALGREKVPRNGRWMAQPKLVVLTAYVWNRYDEDGLAAALKPVVDGLVDARVIHKDDTTSGHQFVRRQQINRKHRGVEVVVEPRPWSLTRPGEAPEG